MYFKDKNSGSNLIRCKQCNKHSVDEPDKPFIPIYPKDGESKYWLCQDCNNARSIFSDPKRNIGLALLVTSNGVYNKGGYITNDTV